MGEGDDRTRKLWEVQHGKRPDPKKKMKIKDVRGREKAERGEKNGGGVEI